MEFSCTCCNGSKILICSNSFSLWDLAHTWDCSNSGPDLGLLWLWSRPGTALTLVQTWDCLTLVQTWDWSDSGQNLGLSDSGPDLGLIWLRSRLGTVWLWSRPGTDLTPVQTWDCSNSGPDLGLLWLWPRLGPDLGLLWLGPRTGIVPSLGHPVRIGTSEIIIALCDLVARFDCVLLHDSGLYSEDYVTSLMKKIGWSIGGITIIKIKRLRWTVFLIFLFRWWSYETSCRVTRRIPRLAWRTTVGQPWPSTIDQSGPTLISPTQ